MTGMKIRFARNINIASNKAKGTTFGILLFLLAFAIPRIDNAQDKPNISRSSQQSSPATTSKNVNAGDTTKEVTGAAVTGTIPAGAIMDVKIAPEDSKVTVSVTTDRLTAPQEFTLDDPPRLVLDFPNTENRVKFSRLPINAASVKQVRVQQYQSSPNPIARMAFDLENEYGAHEITVDKTQVRLIFHKSQSKSLPTGGEPAVQLASNQAQKSSTDAPVVDPKPRSSEPAPKVVLASAAPVPVQPVSAPRTESPKVVAVAAPKPRAAESAVKEAYAPAPLVASLAPVAIPMTPKMSTSASSRFSGQPLTLDLIDMPLVDFFRLMAEEGGINIVLDPEVKGRLSMKVTKVPWDQVFEAALVNANLDKQVEGTLVRIARKSTLQEEAKQQESLKKATILAADVETRIKRLNYTKAETMIDALADQKTVRGTVVVDERTNSLILTDIPSSLNKLVQLIESLDIPQPQVEIEARIVSATRDFARDIGVQFGFVNGNLQRVTVGGPNTFGTIGGTRPSATPTSTYAAGNSETGRGASSDQVSGSASVSTGTSTNNQGNYNVNLPANKAFGGIGISIGNIFDTFLLDAAITAGENKGMAKLISQPKVTAQNNSQAIITQGVRFPIQTVANNTISVQMQNAALTLTVTPQITYEGNIVLDMKVENNTPDFGNRVNGIPSIRTSESSTRVLVSDGGTTVIGGILIDSEGNSEDRVPGMASLPIVGNLFRRTSVTRSTQEVLFFVTPRIIK
jgi:type IV pilus secretin PilQ/predicted competence protein